MLEDYLKRIFRMLDTHQDTLKSELQLLENHERQDNSLQKSLQRDLESKSKEDALPLLQQLEWLDRHIEVRKRSRKIVERGLEEMDKIHDALSQFEFHERITMAEFQAESLRKRRERIMDDMIPDLQARMEKLSEEVREIDSRLMTLSEEISLLRRRTEDVIKKHR
jgi:hypothetical protein